MAGEEKTFQEKLQVIIVLNAFTYIWVFYYYYSIMLDFGFNYEVGINLLFCH